MADDIDTIIKKHDYLVKFVANKYATYNQPYDDLCQEGRLGLTYAIEHFDSSKGVKFETYAIWCIKGRIQHYCRDKCDIIYVPRSKDRIRVNNTEESEYLLDIPQEEVGIDHALRIVLTDSIKTLSDIEQFVINKRYLKQHTLKEIGEMLNKHPQCIYNIVQRSLKKLHKHMREACK